MLVGAYLVDIKAVLYDVQFLCDVATALYGIADNLRHVINAVIIKHSGL